MNPRNNPLDCAVEALVSESRDTTPSRELINDTVAVLQRTEQVGLSSNEAYREPSWYGAASIASLVVVLLVAMLFFNPQQPHSLAQISEEIAKTSSVRFECTMAKNVTRIWLQDDYIRYEITHGGPVMIIDAQTRQGIELHPLRKVAKKLNLKGAVPANELINLIGQLKNLRKQKGVTIESLPDEMIGKETLKVFRVKGAVALRTRGDWTLWINRKSLPIKMVVGQGENSLTLTKFVWNEKISSKLFATKLPTGYVWEKTVAAKLGKNRLHYHRFNDLHSIDPTGKNPLRQFPPKRHAEGSYQADMAELSPDGRYLAAGYTSHRGRASHPPERIVLFDRADPSSKLLEVYVRPNAELNRWRFSRDGSKLYVGYWQQIKDKKWPHGLGAEMIDLKTGKRKSFTLPTYAARNGQSAVPMTFAAGLDEGKQMLVVGKALHLATANGKTVRRLFHGSGDVLWNSIRVSPDERRAMFVVRNDKGHSLYISRLATGKSRVIIKPGRFSDIRARWSPDGKEIAFSCRDGDGKAAERFGSTAFLNIIKPDGNGLVTVKKEPTYRRILSIQLLDWR